MSEKLESSKNSADVPTETPPSVDQKGSSVDGPVARDAAPAKDTNIDPELDKLLDNALEDFDRPPLERKAAPTAPPASQASQKVPVTHTDSSHGATGAAANPDALFEEIFKQEMDENTAKQFESAMKAFMQQEPELAQQVEQLAEAAAKADTDADQKEVADKLQETLQNLAKSAEDLQGSMSEEELMKAFTGMGMGQGDDDMAFMPMMQGLMKNLLSKEVLLPSLSEISTKYPGWLADNKEKISKSDYDRYSRQHEFIKQICGTLEQEKDTDSDESKKQRFEEVLDLMQKMQECGQPPPDIVGPMMPGMQFDAQGNPLMPPGLPPMDPNQQCSVM